MKRILPIYMLLAACFFSFTQGTAQLSGVYTELIGQYHTGLFNEVAVEIVAFNAANLAGGMYIYRLQAGSFISTKKMMLIK